jgi:hypothetical protein
MTQVTADDELQLQEQLKLHPELLPLEELGLAGPAIVVGRESSLDSGKVDLVLLGSGGDLAIIEFKTGPANPDFRACLAQLIDYGSDLWGMSLEEFETRVASRYFNGPHCPQGSPSSGATLDEAVRLAWGPGEDDAIDWRERLRAQLRDGSFHYVAVAQRFTPPVLRTLQYLNTAMRTARFSAVELVRFAGDGCTAFEARFVAGAEPTRAGTPSSKTALAGVDELLASVTDDEYRHHLKDLFDGLSTVSGLVVAWGTTGCSLRVTLPGRSPLSIGWVFPPGPPRWMGLTDVTLGWYEDANGLSLTEVGRAALASYIDKVESLPSGAKPKASAIRGRTFGPSAVVANAAQVEEAVRWVAAALSAG